MDAFIATPQTQQRRRLAEIASRAPVRRAANGGWTKWSAQKKGSIAKDYSRRGYQAIRLRLGKQCPPKSTIRGWVSAIANGQLPQHVGRPAILLKEEEEELAASVGEVSEQYKCI